MHHKFRGLFLYSFKLFYCCKHCSLRQMVKYTFIWNVLFLIYKNWLSSHFLCHASILNLLGFIILNYYQSIFLRCNSKTGTFQLNWHFFLSFLGIAQVILTDIKGNFIYLFLIFIAYVYFKILGWFHMKLTQAHRLPTWLSWILLGPYIHQERKIQKISSNLKFFRAALSIVLALP